MSLTQTQEEQLKEVVAAVLEIEANEINESSSPDTIDTWDSLKHMNMVLAIEEEFEVHFEQEEIMGMLNYKLLALTLSEALKRS